MTKEYETKILEIDKDDIINKLNTLGAKKTSEFLMRRWVFDWVEEDPDNINEWIRLREEGKKTTLTYKKRFSDQKESTEEIEVKVDNFDNTAKIFLQIPFKRRFYQENRRMIFKFENIEFMIDEWPGLKPHLEIEGKTKKAMEKGVELLGLKGKECGDVSVNTLYKEIGVDLHKLPELKFEDFKK